MVFEVELSHSGIDVLWNFKDKEIKPSSKYKIEAHGKIYKLTVLNMMKDDEGEYTFYAGENMTSGKLTVAGWYIYHLIEVLMCDSCFNLRSYCLFVSQIPISFLLLCLCLVCSQSQ